MSDSLEKQLQNLLARPDYRPMNKSEIARELNVPSKERAALRGILRDLEQSGTLILQRKGRYAPRSQAGNLVTGAIHFSPKGHAFVSPDPANRSNRSAGIDFERRQRIFIPARHTGTALHGDHVAIRLQKSAAPPKWHRHLPERKQHALSENSVEGRVEKIIERKNKTILGTYQTRHQFHYCIPDNDLLPRSIELDESPGAPEPDHGDKIVIAFDSWESPRSTPRGHIVKVLGEPGTPGLDILSIIYQYQLPLDFPDDVLAEAEAIPAEIPSTELDRREDWRDRFVYTIDPADARDHDDAICVTPLENDGWELAVHIADVSHYVRPGSALDREAELRGNSVYLVDRVIPMLPEKLSNGICSLHLGVDRLTRAAIIAFDSKGNVTATRFTAAVINSKARLSYEEAYELLKPALSPSNTIGQSGSPQDPAGPRSREAAAKPPLPIHLAHAWALASRLRENRFRNGALDLDMPEIKVVLDPDGTPVDLVRVDYDESHQLIEEFMLAANEAVATVTKECQKPSLYRIHEDPDADKIWEYGELARLYGFKIGDLSNRDELQKLLRAIRGTAEEHILKIGFLKSLKRAAYSPDPLGHYGLATVNYTHFTSPIRRYCDLVAHRVLGNIMHETGTHDREDPRPPADKVPVPSYPELADIARHISETERNAASAETDSRKLKELEYLWRLTQSDSPPSFKAVILEIARPGIFVELKDCFIKGLIKREDLPPNSDWFFDFQLQRVIGRHPKVEYRPATEIDVTVAHVDLQRKLIDFAISESP